MDGNNFYFREKDGRSASTNIFNGGHEIHIGQYFAGTCLLMRNVPYYKTVEEMEAFYRTNADQLNIVDECERILSWNQLVEWLLSAPLRPGHRCMRDEAGYAWSTEEFC